MTAKLKARSREGLFNFVAQVDAAVQLSRQEFHSAGRRFVEAMRRKTSQRGPNSLGIVTGKLHGSFNYGVSELGAELTLEGFSTDWKARVHERGWAITPVVAGALAIPLPAARALGIRSPGAAGKLSLVRRPGRNPLLVRRERGRWTPLFVLARGVRLPARLGMARVFGGIVRGLVATLRRRLEF